MAKFLEREQLEELQDFKEQVDISNEEYCDLLFRAYKFKLKLRPRRELTDEEVVEIIRTSLEFYKNIETRGSKASTTNNVNDCFSQALKALGYVKATMTIKDNMIIKDMPEEMISALKNAQKEKVSALGRVTDVSIRATKLIDCENVSRITLDYFWHETFLGQIMVSADDSVIYYINPNTLKVYRDYVRNVLKYIKEEDSWVRVNKYIQQKGILVDDSNIDNRKCDIDVKNGVISLREGVYVDEDGAIISDKK